MYIGADLSSASIAVRFKTDLPSLPIRADLPSVFIGADLFSVCIAV